MTYASTALGARPPDRGTTVAVRLDAVTKTYDGPAGPVHALDGVTLDVPAGTFLAVMGPSGSGKSTLLQCAAGLDRPTGGRVLIDGTELEGRDEAELTRFRRTRIGFVFQELNLLPTLTVVDNVTLPRRLAGTALDGPGALALLDRVGLAGLADRRPPELSGGQQQRVAVARALHLQPRVIFADEPTGALDSGSAREVLTLLRHAVDQLGQTVVMVTHDPVAAAYADRVVLLADGRLAGDLVRPTAEAVAERLTGLREA